VGSGSCSIENKDQLVHYLPFHYQDYNWSYVEDIGYDIASFMYEGTIAQGLAACTEFQHQQELEGYIVADVKPHCVQ